MFLDKKALNPEVEGAANIGPSFMVSSGFAQTASTFGVVAVHPAGDLISYRSGPAKSGAPLGTD